MILFSTNFRQAFRENSSTRWCFRMSTFRVHGLPGLLATADSLLQCSKSSVLVVNSSFLRTTNLGQQFLPYIYSIKLTCKNSGRWTYDLYKTCFGILSISTFMQYGSPSCSHKIHFFLSEAPSAWCFWQFPPIKIAVLMISTSFYTLAALPLILIPPLVSSFWPPSS